MRLGPGALAARHPQRRPRRAWCGGALWDRTVPQSTSPRTPRQPRPAPACTHVVIVIRTSMYVATTTARALPRRQSRSAAARALSPLSVLHSGTCPVPCAQRGGGAHPSVRSGYRYTRTRRYAVDRAVRYCWDRRYILYRRSVGNRASYVHTGWCASILPNFELTLPQSLPRHDRPRSTAHFTYALR